MTRPYGREHHDELYAHSEHHLPSAVVADSLAPVWTEAQALTMMHPSQPGGTSRPIAKGFERVEPVTAEVAAKSHNRMEQRLIIRSCPLAQAGQR